MTIEQATEVVREYMQTKVPVKGTLKAYIYLWNNPEKVGPRVAECGWADMNSGSCYMSSDPDGIGVCAVIERAIIELMDCDDRAKGDESEVLRFFGMIDYLVG